MPAFRYLCELLPNPEDESELLPSIVLEFPMLDWENVDVTSNVQVPPNRVLIKVKNISDNQDRMILDLVRVSKYL